MPDEATIRDEINQTDATTDIDKPVADPDPASKPMPGPADPVPERVNDIIAAGPGALNKPFATARANLTMESAAAIAQIKTGAHEMLTHLDSLGDHAALATAKQKLQEVVFWATHGVVTAPPKG